MEKSSHGADARAQSDIDTVPRTSRPEQPKRKTPASHDEAHRAEREARQLRAAQALATFWLRVEDRLGELGISRNQLARITGIDAASFHRYMKAGSLPPSRHLWLMADALGVAAGYLLGLEKPKRGA